MLDDVSIPKLPCVYLYILFVVVLSLSSISLVVKYSYSLPFLTKFGVPYLYNDFFSLLSVLFSNVSLTTSDVTIGSFSIESESFLIFSAVISVPFVISLFSILILYASSVALIFCNIYSFSLSISFPLKKIESIAIFAMNTTISVAGTRTIENNIFLDSSFFIPFIKLYTAIIITILIYP